MIELIIIAVIIYFVVKFFKKKKAAAAEEQPNTYTENTAPKAPPAAPADEQPVSRVTSPAETPKAPQAAPRKTTLDKPQAAPQKTTLDKPQSAPQSAPQGSFTAAPAGAIEGLDYMDVRKYSDPTKRIPLMMAFAEAGDELAQYEVGQLYVMGLDGMEKDTEKGKALLYKAGRGGATNAIALLAQVCIRQALDSVTNGEKQGLSHEEYMANFTAFYDEGAEALAWGISTGNDLAMDTLSGAFQLGWNQGEMGETLVFATTRALAPRLEELKSKDDGWSNYVLGTIAMRGICMPQDLSLAKSYYQRGAELGDYSSKKALENPLFALDDDEDDE